MTDKKAKKDAEAKQPEPSEEIQANKQETVVPEEQEQDAPSPFRFRRLDGQDPMKYEDVADK